MLSETVDFIFEKLFAYYKVGTISDLAKSMEIPQSTISKWKQRNAISAIKKVCREKQIYDYIFTDINNDKQVDDITFGIFNEKYQRIQNNSSLLNDFRTYILKFQTPEIRVLEKRKVLMELIDNSIKASNDYHEEKIKQQEERNKKQDELHEFLKSYSTNEQVAILDYIMNEIKKRRKI